MVSQNDLRTQNPSGNPYVDGLLGDEAFKQEYVIKVVLQANSGDNGSYGGLRWAVRGAKDAFIDAAAAWSAVANVTINVLPDNYQGGDSSAYTWVETLQDLGSSVLGQHSLPGAGELGGDFNDLSSYFTVAGNKVGGFSYVTFLHEIGHGLGLTHPFDGPAVMPGVKDEDSLGDNQLNTLLNTVMTYNNQVGSIFPPFRDYGWVAGPMAFDIAAIQHLYGANMSYHTGDDAYQLPTVNGPSAFWMAIWDAGGVDTISAEGSQFGATIDLRPASLLDEPNGGGWISRASGIQGGFTIAHGVIIENATGSAGDDFITGNDADNRLIGGGGSDQLKGGAGNDYLDGGDGNNTIDGGDGNDVILNSGNYSHVYGGAGDDSITDGDGAGFLDGGDGNDSISAGAGDDNLQGGAGEDILDGGAGRDYLYGGDGNDSLTGGAGYNDMFGEGGADTLMGGNDANNMDGGDGNDILVGGNGDDILKGGTGDDQMTGGGGNDTYYLDSLGDQVVELANGGTDTIQIAFDTLDFVLPDVIENLILTGNAKAATGNAANNILRASAMDVTLRGLGGDDNITGGAGADHLFGDAGNDKIFGGLGADELSGGAGDDQIFGWISLDGYDPYAGASFNPEGLLGPTNDPGDIISGGAGNDTIFLPGRFYVGYVNGAFAMDEVPRVYVSTDQIDGGSGTDTISLASVVDMQGSLTSIEHIDFVKPAQYSSLSTLVGAGPPARLILGLDQVAMLGAGTVFSGIGALQLNLGSVATFDASSLFGGTGWQMVDGSNISLRLVGGNANNDITGSSLADVIDGGTGVDQMHGGLGDDQYWVDRQDDVIFENAGEGTDTVMASSNFYLYANIENLTMVQGKPGTPGFGAGNYFAVGNDLDNIILGNEAANLIIAGGGNDHVKGDSGGDAIFGQDGNDELSGEDGIDYLVGGAGNDLLDGGDQADALYGEDGDDTLIAGNSFHTDILVGGAGNDLLDGTSWNPFGADYDLMDGGAGDDVYWVDTGDDLTFEAVNGGTDTVHAKVGGTNNGVYLWANVENLILEGTTTFGVGNELDNQMTGNASGNWLLGGAGNDRIIGKGGNDVLFGQAGADSFIFEQGSGGDVIGDFAPGTDKIDLKAFNLSWAQVQAATGENGGTSFINMGLGDFIVLNGVAMSTLHQSDFILA